MNPILMHLADQVQTERQAPHIHQLPRPKRSSAWQTVVPSVSPFPKDHLTMTTWMLDSELQLRLAEMKHEDQLRNSLLRQQLRDAKTSVSFATTVRTTIAHALISLGNAVKPTTCTEEWAETTPRTVA